MIGGGATAARRQRHEDRTGRFGSIQESKIAGGMAKTAIARDAQIALFRADLVSISGQTQSVFGYAPDG
jgi:hypothetical protein